MMSLSSHLAALESGGLIRLAQEKPELEYLFRHALYQEAAYASLLKGDRKELHQAVGETLERLFPDRLEDLAPVLAKHYDEARDFLRALHYYTLAGDIAARRYANSEASMHYRRALEIAKEYPGMESTRLNSLFLAQGRILELSAQYETAQENYQEMEHIATQRGEPHLELTALTALAGLHATINPLYNPKLAMELSERALHLARQMQDRATEVKVGWILLLVHAFSGNYEEALAYGNQSLALAREINLQEQLGLILNDLGRVYMGLGRYKDGQSSLEEGRKLWRDSGNMPMLAENLSNSAANLMMSGEYVQSLALAEEALEVSRKIGNFWGQSYSLEIAGYALLSLGEFSRGFQKLEEAILVGRQAGSLEATVSVPSILAYFYGSIGSYDRGIELIQQALDESIGPMPGAQASLQAVLAILYLWSGDIDRAETTFEKAREIYPSEPFINFMVIINIVEAEIALQKQQYNQAVAKIDELLSFNKITNVIRFLLPDTLLIKGKAHLALNRLGEAHQVLTLARNVAQNQQIHPRLWAILYTLYQVETRLGNESQAGELIRLAREEINTLAYRSIPADLRHPFLSFSQVRAVLEPA
jgi:tetratricopeptide (TPR) repeat protein